MGKKLIFLVLLIFGTNCIAQQFSYKPNNPAFGGDTFNYNWLLSSATAQNGFKADANAKDVQSDLERFSEQVNSQLLSQISRAVLQQQLGDFTEPGSFIFGSLNVEIFESLEGLVVNILDTLTGEQTQVIIPNP
jgi:curli production assembly/transport component CsgF